jgi:excisionase family DNA binding protein
VFLLEQLATEAAALSMARKAEMMIEHFNRVRVTAKVLDLSEKAVYAAIKRQEIPVIRVGRLVRIPGAWLRAAASKGTMSSMS